MKSLYEDIVIDIEKKIANGELNPGDKVYSERSLAIDYKVSRTVVREAFSVLREKGLIDIQPGRGAFISVPSTDNIVSNIQSILKHHDTSIEDVLEVRSELEIIILKKAVKTNKGDNLQELYEIYELMNQKVSIEEYIKLDEQFHKQIACISENTIYELLMNIFVEATQNILFKITHFFPEGIDEANDHHYQIIKAIENKDEGLAVETIQEHMGLIKDEIKILKAKNYI